MDKKRSEEFYRVAELYADVMAHAALFEIARNTARNELLAPIQQQLNDIDAEYTDNMLEIEPIKERYASTMRACVVDCGETLKTDIVRCEYVKASMKVSDPVGFMAFAKEHPEVMSFIKFSNPSTRIVGLG